MAALSPIMYMFTFHIYFTHLAHLIDWQFIDGHMALNMVCLWEAPADRGGLSPGQGASGLLWASTQACARAEEAFAARRADGKVPLASHA